MTASPLSRQRILVVDDEADSRELTRLILRAHGAEAVAVESAFEALSLLELEKFDVLLADIGLGGISGYKLIRAVRALRGGNLPAVAVTGYATAKDRNDALAAGYDWHVTKPVDPTGLVDVVAGVLAGRRMRPGDS